MDDMLSLFVGLPVAVAGAAAAAARNFLSLASSSSVFTFFSSSSSSSCHYAISRFNYFPFPVFVELALNK